jgi:hypothetical protein
MNFAVGTVFLNTERTLVSIQLIGTAYGIKINGDEVGFAAVRAGPAFLSFEAYAVRKTVATRQRLMRITRRPDRCVAIKKS